MPNGIAAGADRADRIEPDAVRSQLAKVLADSSFAGAPQMSRLLQHVVENALTGDDREVKEYSLGVVLGRGTSFDTRTDNIVRSHARRLRQRLDAYFAGPGRSDPIVIEIPKGHYRAVFRANDSPEVLSVGDATHVSHAVARSHRYWYAAIAVSVGVAVGASAWWWQYRPGVAPLPTHSIAVLPFTPMSEDPAIRHRADAFVEQLLNDLTAQRQIKVASRTASVAKPAEGGIAAFAAELGVSYVVEGSVRASSDSDRITAQLIRGSDGRHLLSQTIELGRDDVEIDAVASRVALNAFRYVDNDVEIARARTETTNDAAFAHWENAFRLDPSGQSSGEAAGTRAGQAQDLMNLDKAIELDPGFPEPYFWRGVLVPDPVEARRMIDRYLQLRPDSALGHTRRGLLQMGDGDLAAAEQSFKHAHELEPELPWPVSCLGHLAMRRGRALEAADYYKQSTVNDAAKPNHFFYGVALVALEQFDEADRQFGLDLRMFPDDALAIAARVQVAHLRGRDDEAKARFDAAWAKYGKVAPGWFIQVLPMMGHEQDLRDRMKQWDAGTIPAPTVARFLAYNALQEYDAAIDWLLRSLDEGIGSWPPEYGPFIRLEKLYPEIHKHPRYAEVAAKLDAKEVTH